MIKRIIEWFIDNPIAANLLMVTILFVGLKNLPSMGKSVFPQTDQGSIEITATYRGASPQEVEQQVIVRLEEAVADLEGIEEMTSTARESSALLLLDVVKDYDSQRLLNNVKSRIDALITLPDEVENIQVSETVPSLPLMSIAVHGSVDEALLKETAQWLRDELALLSSVSTVDIEGVRNNEMSIEISEQTLRQYNLTFNEVANRIRNTSLNVPGGTVKTDSGNIQVQTRGQAYSADEFANIVIATNDDGAQLLLGDVANVEDGFEDVDSEDSFNGQSAAYLELFTTTPPNVLTAAAEARETIDILRPRLPPGIEMTISTDRSTWFKSRMNLLLENAAGGLLLVFIVLMLFLSPVLAGWVSAGIATAFIGVFVVLPYTGVTVNMLSMYGFLLALGIVVDDAIIVGESIYAQQRKGLHGVKAAKLGAVFVHKPVLFAVISTILFFSGMFGLPGWMGSLAAPIAVVVIICLLFSLIESLFILPSHLSHAKAPRVHNNPGVFTRLRERLSSGLEHFAAHRYRPLLEKTLRRNGQSSMLFFMAFIIIYTIYSAGGYVKTSFKVQATSNNIRITAVLAEGAPFSDVRRIQKQIENAASQLADDPTLVKINGDGVFVRAIRSFAENNSIRMRVALMPAEDRVVNIIQVKDRLRTLIGPLEGVKEFNLSYTINANIKAIRFRVNVAGNNTEHLSGAVNALKERLYTYASIYDIEDTLEGSRREIELRLKPHAEVVGLSLVDIARQIRQGYYGEEIQRIPRGTEDIKVMLRYPADERKNIESLENIYIRTSDGRSVPLSTVAEVIDVPGYSVIRRENRRRTIIVSADVTEGADALAIANEIITNDLPQWQQQYRGLHLELAGSLTDQKAFNLQLILNMAIAILISYGLMAIAFRSYWQPLLILTAIPFGFVGAVLGHIIMDETINTMSMLGVLACSGVVVNDNLVLLDRIHQLYKKGGDLYAAVAQAGEDRFRAIILTSITTFIGLMPIMFETSVQAQFLIPLVVSLSFGVLFSTIITLILVPNLFVLGERFGMFLTHKNHHQEH